MRHILLLSSVLASVLVSILSYAHSFTEAICDKDELLVSALIAENYDVNEYDYETESSPLVDAIASGNLQIILLLLNAGANPNECMIFHEGRSMKYPLSYATTLSQIVLLLAYGSNPNNDNAWEYNQAISDDRFLHLLVYPLWDFEDKPKKPKTIEQLNNIIFSLPVLRIQTFISLLTSAVLISGLSTRDELFLKNAYITL